MRRNDPPGPEHGPAHDATTPSRDAAPGSGQSSTLDPTLDPALDLTWDPVLDRASDPALDRASDQDLYLHEDPAAVAPGSATEIDTERATERERASAQRALEERGLDRAALKRAAVPLVLLVVGFLSLGLLSDLLRRAGGPSERATPSSTVAPVTPEQLQSRVKRPEPFTASPFKEPEPIERRPELARASTYRRSTGPAPAPTSARRPRLVARGLADPPQRPAPRQIETRDAPPAPTLVLTRGTTLHARLERDVTSESFTSAVVARLTYPVYEQHTGLLIFPEQTELHGVVVRDPALGSSRVGIRWSEAILPTSHGGRTVRLDQPASDAAGVEGVGTDVSHRWASFYGHAAVMSVLSALVQGAQHPEGGNAGLEAYGAAELARQSEEVTRSVLRRLQNRRPRYLLPRGSRVAVQVERTLEVAVP